MKSRFSKLMLIAGIILMASGVVQAGEYDGVWTSPDFAGLFFIVRHQPDSILFIELDSTLSTCDTLFGKLDENIATISMFNLPDEDHLLAVQVSFYTSTKASGKFISCTGNCDSYPLNKPWELNKIY
jgi:hypothetical protein